MKHQRLSIFALFAVGLFAGCGRDAPPAIPDFVAPFKAATVESTVPEPVGEKVLAAAAPTVPPRKEVPITKPSPVATTPVVTASPTPEAAAAPSIVGTWQIVEMSHNGQSQSMPPGMQMTLTFDASGTVAMSVSSGQMPQPHTEQGTYTLSNDQITMTLSSKTLTGMCAFEGTNKVTLDFTEVKMVLSRS